jgi:hypothetical protein
LNYKEIPESPSDFTDGISFGRRTNLKMIAMDTALMRVPQPADSGARRGIRLPGPNE